MLDVTYPLGQAGPSRAPRDGVSFDSGFAFDAADTSDSCDDSVLMAEPDGDVFGWDDDEDEDDEDDFEDDDAVLADDFDDDEM